MSINGLSEEMSKMIRSQFPKVYKADNNFAYHFDNKDEKKFLRDSKTYNFVPTYDNWCLTCDKKGIEKKCSKCKSVYFCDRECQRKAWKTHKKHCGRDLFSNCSFCGGDIDKSHVEYFKCPDCPIKICSNTCKGNIFKQHKDMDCEYFSKVFGKTYLNYE